MTTARLTLVVAVDGSAASLRAVAHAVRLGQETPCELHLCNVHMGAGSSESAHATLQEARRAVQAAGMRASVEVRHGDPAEQIARQARDVGADLIVMGTRGQGAARAALLGSVAQRVAEIAPCPVVTLR